MTTLTALVTVYARIDPHHFREALASLAQQTRAPDEVVLVADGTLTVQLERIIDEFTADSGLRCSRVDLQDRRGAGPARAAGLEAATGELVAVVDADDVSYPDRFDKQVEILESGAADIVGADMDEFDADSGEFLGVRHLPSTHRQILQLAGLNNPINHPTLMFRREEALAAGSYRELEGLEDYDLVARMLGAGATAHNISVPLVRYRGGRAAQRRRRAWSVVRSELALQRTLLREGLIPHLGVVRNLVVRTAYRLVPASVGTRVYARLFLSAPPQSGAEARPEYDRHVNMKEVRGPLASAFAEQALRTSGYTAEEARLLRVLDVGAGYGDTARELARRCAHVTCLEPAADLHEVSRRTAEEAELDNMDFVHGGVEDLEAEDAYDFIVLDNVFEHLAQPGVSLERLWCALRPGGRLYLLTPNKLWPVEAHYGLIGLSWLPLSLANRYLRLSGRGSDYTDASYAPTYWSLKRHLGSHGPWAYEFVLPGDLAATVAGAPLHYRVGMALIRRWPFLWSISKALLVVAVKPGERTEE